MQKLYKPIVVKIFYMLSILFIGSNIAQANIAVYLKKAHQISSAVDANRQDLKTAKLNHVKAYTNFLPSVSLSGNKTKLDRKISTSSSTEDKYTTRNFTVSQNLFNGGTTLSNVALTKIQNDIAKLSYRNFEQQFFLDSASVYLGYVLAKEQLKVAESSEKALAKHLESTQIRFELGEVTKTDVAQANARYSQSVSEKIKFKGSVDAALANFVRTFGENPTDSIIMPKMPKNLPSNIHESLRIAKNNNLEILIADLQVKAAGHGIKINWGKILPSVDLQGTASKTEYSRYTDQRLDKSLVVSVTVPVFQNGSEYIDILNSHYTKDKAKLLYDDASKKLLTNVNDAYVNLTSSAASLDSANATVESAELAYDGVLEESKIGLKTTLDLLNAEQELFQAKLALVNAEYQTIMLSYKLLATLGILNLYNL